LVRTGIENGYRLRVIEAVESVNETQKSIVFDKLSVAFGGELKGKVIAVWGLSFKPETDDMRESPALVVIDKLLQAGAEVRVYDPIAMEETRRRIGDNVTYCTDMYEAVIDADAIALLTEWKVFRMPSWAIIHKAMRNHVVVDGRNIYESDELKEAGFMCSRIGRKQE
ncbi:UDP-glucose 6-dehydrogenase TuaD, partial [termite gut metagenome]